MIIFATLTRSTNDFPLIFVYFDIQMMSIAMFAICGDALIARCLNNANSRKGCKFTNKPGILVTMELIGRMLLLKPPQHLRNPVGFVYSSDTVLLAKGSGLEIAVQTIRKQREKWVFLARLLRRLFFCLHFLCAYIFPLVILPIVFGFIEIFSTIENRIFNQEKR